MAGRRELPRRCGGFVIRGFGDFGQPYFWVRNAGGVYLSHKFPILLLR